MNTITVFSPKGGVGTTTIAANLAIAFHKNFKEEVLLVDGKLLFGHIALYLNILTGNSITDLIKQAGMLDEHLIRQVAVKHNSGIHVIPCPNTITEAQGIKPESLFDVLRSLQKVFPNIIIDGGNDLDNNTVTYMDASDKILLVLNPEMASLRDVKQFIEVSASLSYPKEKLLLLLNLIGRKADMQTRDIEEILHWEIFGQIPADENLALTAINEGIPIIQRKPRHTISKTFFQWSM